MEAKRQNRNTLLFVGFFLLAGILHVVENHCHNLPSPDYSAVTILFLVIFMIYTALLIFWIQSVRIRFLPSRERSYMIWIMLLMILYLCLCVFRWRNEIPENMACGYHRILFFAALSIDYIGGPVYSPAHRGVLYADPYSEGASDFLGCQGNPGSAPGRGRVCRRRRQGRVCQHYHE